MSKPVSTLLVALGLLSTAAAADSLLVRGLAWTPLDRRLSIGAAAQERDHTRLDS